MKTRFAFGKHGIEVMVPDEIRCEVVRRRAARALGGVAGALDAALDGPIGCEPLARLAAGKRTAAIAVCDITRPAPNRVTLPPLLKRLEEAGIGVEGIAILIATGLHRAATREELDAILGPEIAAKYRVASHDARDLAAHRALGVTRRETPVYIDERFVAADLHITLGLVEPHMMLGFSGGRKMIAPGLGSQETIKALHSSRFVREPLATEGSIAGNPLHDELLKIAAMARHDFILGVTLTREREISGVFAGHPVKAHAAAVEFFERTSLTVLDEPADAAITSAGGYPPDLTFYQCIKGLSAAQHVVKPGGRILLLGECTEGAGSAEYARQLKAYPGYTRFLESILDTEVKIDQWQLEQLALAGLRNELLFYTPGVAKDEMGSLGAMAFGNLGEAVAALAEGLAPGARVALLPQGPYTYARAMPALA